MKSNQLDKRDIFRKNSLTMWYQNVQDIPCLTCSWCTQHWRQNINMHNFSGGSLAGKGKNARVSSNRWYLHACNSLRLRFLLQQRLLFPAFTSAMTAKQLTEKWTEKTIHYLNDQSNSPTCYISKRDIEFYHHRPIKRWLELPKTTKNDDIFKKSAQCGTESTGW